MISGGTHTLTLTNQTFGTSGIGLIESIFNQGPIEVAGGDSIVNAKGWTPSAGYGVTWVFSDNAVQAATRSTLTLMPPTN